MSKSHNIALKYLWRTSETQTKCCLVTKISFKSPSLFQISGDLEDLESALKKDGKKPFAGAGHCSALIKLLPGNRDLYVAHDTWNTYQGMLRIIKKYEFPFKTAENCE